ncbi:hypothetical protein VCHA53O466_50447 [Vibrio chagasii]|nr:hypothetical protein VCHA53O466_50447 [Vibrio chagasii]
MKVPHTTYGHRLGQEAECTNSGAKGIISCISTHIAGCQFVTLDCKVVINGKETTQAFTSSTVNTKTLNNSRVMEYENNCEKNSPSLGEIELGCEVVLIRSGRKGIVCEYSLDFSGSITLSVSFPYDQESQMNGDDKLSAVFIGEIERCGDGIVEKLNKNITKRSEGTLETPKKFMRVRSIIDGCEGVVAVVAEYSNGTMHIGIQPENWNNKKPNIEFHDVELIEIIRDKEDKPLVTEGNANKGEPTGCIMFEGTNNLMRSI